ncbi:hypothetical protein Tco_1482986 [Tanacetum coccineum]
MHTTTTTLHYHSKSLGSPESFYYALGETIRAKHSGRFVVKIKSGITVRKTGGAGIRSWKPWIGPTCIREQTDDAQVETKKKGKQDSPKPPPGSPPSPPPPPPPPSGASGASGTTGASDSAKLLSNTPVSSTRQEDQSTGHWQPRVTPKCTSNLSDDEVGRDHVPTVNLRQSWWKPLTEDRPSTPEPAWTIPSSDLSMPTNNWASASEATYGASTRRTRYLLKRVWATFWTWFVNSEVSLNLLHRNLEGPAFEIIKGVSSCLWFISNSKWKNAQYFLQIKWMMQSSVQRQPSHFHWEDRPCQYPKDEEAYYPDVGLVHWCLISLECSGMTLKVHVTVKSSRSLEPPIIPMSNKFSPTKHIMGEPLLPDHVFDFPEDDLEPHPAYDFFTPARLPGYAGNPNNNNGWLAADDYYWESSKLW